ncbi:MAG: stage V sporulation protein AA [Lachnospiraceae bacterium]
MEEKTVYIKPELNILVENTKITLSDVAQVYSYDDKLAKEVGEIEVLRIQKKEKQKTAMSVMRLVRLISDYRPDITVVNLGEKDFIVEYKPPEKPKRILEWGKTFCVSLIVFAGSAFTIMSFNEDASVQKIFQSFYQLVLGDGNGNGWLEVSYSIGLPLGIILFFNHFTTAKIDTDPTPLQIQMRQYEQNEGTAIIENASREGRKLEK